MLISLPDLPELEQFIRPGEPVCRIDKHRAVSSTSYCLKTKLCKPNRITQVLTFQKRSLM